jgi:hypothetical protein
VQGKARLIDVAAALGYGEDDVAAALGYGEDDVAAALKHVKTT